jgi:hypothetical protein
VLFVAAEYFGYLRRDPDQGGYDFWLGQGESAPSSRRGHSARDGLLVHQAAREDQERFSSVVLHNNAECPQ